MTGPGADPPGEAWAEAFTPIEAAVVVEAPQELNHSSYVVAGLFDLEHAGLLGGCRVVPTLDVHRGERHVDRSGAMRTTSFHAYKTVFLTVTGRRTVSVAVDLRDAADVFPVDGLNADLLFKRSYRDTEVAAVAVGHPALIAPAGLSFAVRSDHDRSRGRRAAGFWATILRYNTRVDRQVFHRLRREIRAAGRHRRSAHRHPTTAGFRTPVGRRAEPPTVVFKTRTFDRDDDPDAVAVHEQRAGLIRTLRDGLGDAFVGGFVPSAFARRRYGDCLADGPSDPVAYRQALAGAAVVVSTRGLVGSTQWKLAEALALGSCVVSESVRTRLTHPLDDVIATFADNETCLAECVRLLDDPDARDDAARRAHDYYRTWVDPPVSLHRMISRAAELANA